MSLTRGLVSAGVGALTLLLGSVLSVITLGSPPVGAAASSCASRHDHAVQFLDAWLHVGFGHHRSLRHLLRDRYRLGGGGGGYDTTTDVGAGATVEALVPVTPDDVLGVVVGALARKAKPMAVELEGSAEAAVVVSAVAAEAVPRRSQLGQGRPWSSLAVVAELARRRRWVRGYPGGLGGDMVNSTRNG